MGFENLELRIGFRIWIILNSRFSILNSQFPILNFERGDTSYRKMPATRIYLGRPLKIAPEGQTLNNPAQGVATGGSNHFSVATGGSNHFSVATGGSNHFPVATGGSNHFPVATGGSNHFPVATGGSNHFQGRDRREQPLSNSVGYTKQIHISVLEARALKNQINRTHLKHIWPNGNVMGK